MRAAAEPEGDQTGLGAQAESRSPAWRTHTRACLASAIPRRDRVCPAPFIGMEHRHVPRPCGAEQRRRRAALASPALPRATCRAEPARSTRVRRGSHPTRGRSGRRIARVRRAPSAAAAGTPSSAASASCADACRRLRVAHERCPTAAAGSRLQRDEPQRHAKETPARGCYARGSVDTSGHEHQPRRTHGLAAATLVALVPRSPRPTPDASRSATSSDSRNCAAARGIPRSRRPRRSGRARASTSGRAARRRHDLHRSRRSTRRKPRSPVASRAARASPARRPRGCAPSGYARRLRGSRPHRPARTTSESSG